MNTDFRPTVFLKDLCPFSFKVRVALLEMGMIGDVDIKVLVPDTQEELEARAVLGRQFESVSFPAAEIKLGTYMKDSDALVRHFASTRGLEPGDLPTLQAYKKGPLRQLLTLYRENNELKKATESDDATYD